MNRFSWSAIALAIALPASAVELTNLPGITTSASSEYFLPTNGPAVNIIDDNYLTYWNAGGFGGYVQVDFLSVYQLDRIELYGAVSGFPRLNNYSLLGSEDGTSWATIAGGSYHADSTLDPVSLQYGASHDFSGPSAPVARYVRYVYQASPEWAYLGEIHVAGHVPVANVPEPETYALLGSGLALMGLALRRRR